MQARQQLQRVGVAVVPAQAGAADIGAEPGLGMGEIATLAVVPAASLTRYMDKLVERGIVVRRIDPGDKRRSVVALSPRGVEYAARLRAAEAGVASEGLG